MRTLTHPAGVTLDGFIAAPDGSFDFSPVDRPLLESIAAEFPETLPTPAREQLGPTGAGTRLDTALMAAAPTPPRSGAGITSLYAHLRRYVVSTTLPAGSDPRVRVVSEDPWAWSAGSSRSPAAGCGWPAVGAWPASCCPRSTSWS